MAHTAATLSPRRWIALVRAAVWIVATRAALALLPWRRVSEWFASPDARQGEPDLKRARIDLWAVQAMTRRLLRGRPCLTQALVARRFLRRRGVDTTLRLGATRQGAQLMAHAWLERDGHVVIGGVDSPDTYASFQPAQSAPSTAEETWAD